MTDGGTPIEPSGRMPARAPRAVPARRALAWFAEGMRLWKRGPATFAILAFATLVISIVFEPVPFAGFVAANIVAPLIATGMLFASLAADRGDRPRFRHLLAPFAAPAGAQMTVVLSGLVVFAAEAFAAWQLAGANLFLPASETTEFSMRVIAGIYATGIVFSLPLTFVPFAAMFDGEGTRGAFAISVRAFACNVPALLLYGAISLALLLLGLATMGVGLILVLPWVSAASYAAWKDIFALGAPGIAG